MLQYPPSARSCDAPNVYVALTKRRNLGDRDKDRSVPETAGAKALLKVSDTSMDILQGMGQPTAAWKSLVKAEVASSNAIGL